MSRHFVGNTADRVNLGDITAARFLRTTAWSVMCLFRTSDVTTDDQSPIGKWNSGTSTKRMFFMRVDKGTNPQNMEIYTKDALTVTGGNVIQNDSRWFLCCVTCKGDSSASDVTLHTYDFSSGTWVDDALTGTHKGNNSNLTEPISIATTKNSPSDPMKGDIAHAIYVDAELTRRELTSYLFDPVGMAAMFKAKYGVQFYLPLVGESPEPDWSGNGNSGTVEGTDRGREDDPPITIGTPKWAATAPLIETGAAAAAARRRVGIGAGSGTRR